MAPSPLADLTPESAARVLAIMAVEARTKRAADGDGGVVDTLKTMASSGTAAAGDVASKVRDWFAAHPELKAPLIGAGTGALLAGGNAAVRKKRNPLGAALLGGLTGAGLGATYSALSGVGGDARTEKIDQAGADADAARKATMSATARLGDRVAPIGAVAGALTSGSSDAAKDVGGAALEHPGAAVGAGLGMLGGISHGRDQTLLANIRANTRTPGDVKSLYPDVDAGKPGAPAMAPDVRAEAGTQLNRDLADPAFLSKSPALRGQLFSRDRNNFSRTMLGPNDHTAVPAGQSGIRPGLGGLLDARPIPLTQAGRQAAYARRAMTADDNWNLARPPASGSPAPGSANFLGQAGRGLGGAVAGGLLGYGVERLGKGLLGSIGAGSGYNPTPGAFGPGAGFGGAMGH